MGAGGGTDVAGVSEGVGVRARGSSRKDAKQSHAKGAKKREGKKER